MLMGNHPPSASEVSIHKTFFSETCDVFFLANKLVHLQKNLAAVLRNKFDLQLCEFDVF